MMSIEKSRQCVEHDLHALVLIIWRRSRDFEEEFTQELYRLMHVVNLERDINARTVSALIDLQDILCGKSRVKDY